MTTPSKNQPGGRRDGTHRQAAPVEKPNPRRIHVSHDLAQPRAGAVDMLGICRGTEG